MKSCSLFLPVLVGTLLSAATADAGTLVHINFEASTRSTNAGGKVVNTPVTGHKVVRECARNRAPPVAPASLALVLDVDSGRVSVVDRATGTNVCEVFQFDEITSAADADSGYKVRHLRVRDPGAAQSAGSAVANERSSRDDNGVLVKYHLNGKFHLSYPSVDGSAPKVCNGTFNTGRRFTPTAPVPVQ